MIPISIVCGLIVCLFGGHLDSATDRGTASASKSIRQKRLTTNRPKMEEIITMNSKCHAIAEWDFSRWFVVLSPLIGVLLGFLGVFLVNP
jgi:hypothetical protein